MVKSKKDKKWIIVSNRLPVNYDKKTGKFSQSTGGLVSALANVELEGTTKWVGYTDAPMSIKKVSGLVPVSMDKDLYSLYYNGMSNNVIWPLFHYESTFVDFSWESWDAYKKVNKIFAERVLSVASPNDVIWVHDYHLFLLPIYLRKKMPSLSIGFFLHIPFPSSEVFRSLAVRKELLQGVLHANLIGFQDFEYLRHFTSSVYNILGVESDLSSIEDKHYKAQLGVFPVSIDVKKFLRKKKSKKVNEWKKKYRQPNKKIILGVDRLDYIKGIDLKFRTFRQLLKRHPEWIGKVHLYQVAVPSRVHVEEYVHTKNEAERLVGQINGEFGFPGYAPIHYIFSSVSFDQLLALYDVADALFVSSKRDGMNLVSMEYIVAQDEKDPGLVLLSEFTGASSILSHSIPVNPWNFTDSADRIHQALTMSLQEKKARNAYMVEYLMKYDSTMWAKTFLKKLELSKRIIDVEQSEHIQISTSGKIKIPKQLDSLIGKKRIILFLDYDGTLTAIRDNPSEAILDAETKTILKKLAKKSDIDGLVIVTGRDSKFIFSQIKDIGISIASEHGAKFYDRRHKKWIPMVPPSKIDWYHDIEQIMEEYANRVPGSFVEKKEYAISWHFRNSPSQFGEYMSRKLYSELESVLTQKRASLLSGKKVIEARAIEANKGQFARWYLSSYERTVLESDYHVIALGDDKTDEELFLALQGVGTAIRIGESNTIAPFYLESQEDIKLFLKYLDEKLK